MVTNSPKEAKIYIDFFLETSNMPFGIDIWAAEQRARATEYIPKLGVQDKFITALPLGIRISKGRCRGSRTSVLSM